MRRGISLSVGLMHVSLEVHWLSNIDHLDRHCNPSVRMNQASIVEILHDVFSFKYAIYCISPSFLFSNSKARELSFLLC